MPNEKKEMEWPDKDLGLNIKALVRNLDRNAGTLGLPGDNCKKFSMSDLVNHPLLALKDGCPID